VCVCGVTRTSSNTINDTSVQMRAKPHALRQALLVPNKSFSLSLYLYLSLSSLTP